jgi:D-threo-aldose 1-dehydrogenase
VVEGLMSEIARDGGTGGIPAELRMRRLGRTGLMVTELGLGTGPIGGFATRPVDDETAQATLSAAWEAGIRLFDTAPWYGLGAAEERLGRFLRSRPREEFVISTKVGRVLDPHGGGQPATSFWATPLFSDFHFDYSHDGVLRSFEDSLERLGLASVDLLLIHDLEPGTHGGEAGFAKRMAELDEGGGFKALAELREQRVVAGIGIGVGDAAIIPALLERFDLDVLLQAGEWTLLDQRALDTALPACEEAGVAVIEGAVFKSGILASGAVAGAMYDYRPAPEEVLEHVRRLERVCARHGVELGAAALAFPLGHRTVAAVLPGAAHPEEVRKDVALFSQSIPPDLWFELRDEGLIRADAPLPESGLE